MQRLSISTCRRRIRTSPICHYDTDDEYVYKTYFLTLTSQQWRDASEVDRPVWEHEMSITVPAGLDGDDNPTAVLVVAGGSNGGPPLNDTQEEIGAAALLGQSVIAVVRQVPNEPLTFVAEQPPQPRSEDALVAYSMHRFLESCDAAAQNCDGEWPVQAAMTKATVRAMDAVQQFLNEKGVEIRDFVVTGASKRGWTTWLTAAVDPRVKGIAPISADLLNLPAQADRQWAVYGGRYPPALEPYAQFDIFCHAKREAAAGDALWRIVDPYSYRERLTMPKLIVNSAGDEFFLPDASRLYLHELPGENRLRYTFNTDHAQSGEEVDVLRRIVEWAKDVAEDKAVPGLNWKSRATGCACSPRKRLPGCGCGRRATPSIRTPATFAWHRGPHLDPAAAGGRGRRRRLRSRSADAALGLDRLQRGGGVSRVRPDLAQPDVHH